MTRRNCVVASGPARWHSRLFVGMVVMAGVSVMGQDPVKPDPAKTDPVKVEEQKPAAAAAAPAAESPVPSGENWLTGSVDLGYRWITGPGGSFDTYRSIVNLGSGPKLIGSDFTITDPKHRAFDTIHVRAYSWGDEPYETLHFDMKKAKYYDFNADYRDFAYFNFLPSYADPLIGAGSCSMSNRSMSAGGWRRFHSTSCRKAASFRTWLSIAIRTRDGAPRHS